MRPRGGIIGASTAPTQSAAGGIWTLREAEAYSRATLWPALAGAPTSVAGTSGNAQVALTWTAPSATGGSSITGYSVKYTPSGGSTSTVATGRTTTSYSVTGLTNGTQYTFSVAAVTGYGTGAYSSTATATPANSGILSFSAAPNADDSVGTGAILYGTSSSDWTGSGTAASPYVWRAGQTVSDSSALNALKTTVNYGQGPNVETHLMFKATAPCYLYIANDIPNDDNGHGGFSDFTFRWRKLIIDDNGNTAIKYPMAGLSADQSFGMANTGRPITVYDASGVYSYSGSSGLYRSLAVDEAHPAYVVFAQIPSPGWCKNFRIWAVPI